MRLIPTRLRHRLGILRRLPREAYYTLSGWRFNDLKDHIAGGVAQDHDVALTMKALESVRLAGINARPFPKTKIGLVTCLPPDESGIANFSFEHLAQFDEPIAVFSQVRDVERHFYNSAFLSRASKGNVALFPMSSLLGVHALLDFEKIVFVIGNSNHNVEAFRHIEKLAALGVSDRIVCYLHDPCCLNVVQTGKMLSDSGFAGYIGDIYADKNPPDSFRDKWHLHESMVAKGIYGIRALYEAGAQEFIVNSKFAKDLIEADLTAVQREKTKINVLFHPVLTLKQDVAGVVPEARTVGTFGAAAWAKATDVVLEAVEKLNSRGRPTNLIIAGYDAKRFVENIYGGNVPSWLRCEEPATELGLQLQMARCDLAIQLRRSSLGESSGVVPTLIGMEKTTIVSPIGAFSEYGDAVHYVPGYDSEELAKAIENIEGTTSPAMKRYNISHSVAKFNKKLVSLLGINAKIANKKIAVYGACHSEALHQYIDDRFDQKDAAVVGMRPYFVLGDKDINNFKKNVAPDLDWFIYQPISENARGLDYATASILPFLGENTRTMRFSYPHFELYNPFSVSRVDGLPPSEEAYIDYAVGALVMQGYKGEEIVQRYHRAASIGPFADRLRDWAISSLKEREDRTLPGDQALEIKCSDFIKQHFRETRLFACMNHPTNALLLPMFEDIVSRMDIGTGGDTNFDKELLGDTLIPIPDYVREAFDLQFPAENTFKLRGRAVTLAEYVSLYETYFAGAEVASIKAAIEQLAMSRPWFEALLKPNG